MAHLVLSSVVAYLMLSERVFLRFSTGGRGILPVLDLWILLLGAALVVFSPSAVAFMHTRAFWKYWFPYMSLAFVLPVMAVFLNDYPARTALQCLQGAQIFCFFVIGSWMSSFGQNLWHAMRRYLFAVIAVEFVFTGIQFGYVRGWLSGTLCDLLHQWDMTSQITYSEQYIVSTRSIGTYLNPNTLGYWAGTAFWASLFVLRGTTRMMAATAAIVTLFASQSRGSMLAFIVSGVVWFGYVLLSRRQNYRNERDVTLAIILIGLIGLTWAGIMFGDQLGDVSFLDRFERGFRFFSEGADADRNIAGRIGGWIHALQFYQDHPLGTMGEPRFVFRDIIDNDYVRTLLQGSVVYLLAFLMALFGALRQMNRHSATGVLVGLCASVVAIDAMTAHPLSCPAAGIFWMAIGYHLYGLVVARLQQQSLTVFAPPVSAVA